MCIAIAKCDLFFHYGDAKEISFYYIGNTKICATHENSIYIFGILFLI